MFIKLNFENNETITIKLLEKDSVKKWFNHFRQFEDRYYYEYHSDSGYRKPNPELVAKYWANIHLAFAELRDIGYNVPYDLPTEPTYDQPLLNSLHRFFTYNALWASDQHSSPNTSIPNPFDPDFRLPSDYDFSKWHDIIDVVNQNVHFLEAYLVTPRKKNANENFYTGCFYFIPLDQNDKLANRIPMWHSFTPSEVEEINVSELDYTGGLPVILNKSILGKCFLQSFIEDDDPTARDCTGRLGSFGAFLILSNNKRSQLYNTEEFRDWATGHGLKVEDMHLEAQIGNVYNTTLETLDVETLADDLILINVEFLDSLST